MRVIRETPLWLAARHLLADSASHFFREAKRATGNPDVDAIHDLRVSSRRLRETISVFERAYPERSMRRVKKFVRTVTSALGDLRNLDELIIFLTSIKTNLNKKGVSELASFISNAKKSRKPILRTVSQKLHSVSGADNHTAIMRIFNAPRILRSDLGEGACDGVGLFALGILKAKRSRMNNLFDAANNESDIEAQHELRIEIKHYRYAFELFKPIADTSFKEVLARLKCYQSLLGTMHDMDVFLEMVQTRDFSEALHKRLVDIIRAKRKSLFKEFAQVATAHPVPSLMDMAESAFG